MSAEALCRDQAARRRAAFLSLEQGRLRLEVREPAAPLARALAARGWKAEAAESFVLDVEAEDWEAFWRQAGPLLDCGC